MWRGLLVQRLGLLETPQLRRPIPAAPTPWVRQPQVAAAEVPQTLSRLAQAVMKALALALGLTVLTVPVIQTP